MRRGYSVFRNLSPAGPIDLVAIDKAGNVLKIDVKSSYPSLSAYQTSQEIVGMWPDGEGGWLMGPERVHPR